MEKKKKKSPAATYSPASWRRSTIGARGLDFRVREGNGYYTPAIATGHIKHLPNYSRNNTPIKAFGGLSAGRHRAGHGTCPLTPLIAAVNRHFITAIDTAYAAISIHLWNNNMVKPRGGLVLVG